MKRYEVVRGSKSGHCCFEATVVDTGKPEMIRGEPRTTPDGRAQFETVCECFDVADAQRVCDALNALG